MHFRVLLVAALTVTFLTASAAAEGAYRFGSELDSSIQPQPGQPCDQAHPRRVCTWIMNEAFGRPNGGHKASRHGTITKIRVIAEDAGRFRLQIARARETASGYTGKVVRNGPVIRYEGQPDPDEPYAVEVFSVNVPVRKGERLAIKARRTSAIRTGGGGDNTLLFYPPLTPGGVMRANTEEEGLYLLIEAVVRPAAR